jgi:cytoskeletal protein CcmA (bactofilin family)
MTTGSSLVAVLGEESSLSGRFVGQDLTVLGHFDGDLKANGVVKIGRQATVKATIEAGAVEVEGVFEGEIRTSRLFFGATARAQGVFLSDRLMIQDGAIVEGSVNQPPAAKAEAVAQPEAAAEPNVAEAATSAVKVAEAPEAVVSETGTASGSWTDGDPPEASAGTGGFPYVTLASPDSASVTYAATGLLATPSWHPHQQQRHRRRRHM